MRRFEIWRGGIQIGEGVKFSNETWAVNYLPSGLRFTYNASDLYVNQLLHDNDIKWLDPEEENEDDESSEAYDE